MSPLSLLSTRLWASSDKTATSSPMVVRTRIILELFTLPLNDSRDFPAFDSLLPGRFLPNRDLVLH